MSKSAEIYADIAAAVSGILGVYFPDDPVYVDATEGEPHRGLHLACRDCECKKQPCECYTVLVAVPTAWIREWAVEYAGGRSELIVAACKDYMEWVLADGKRPKVSGAKLALRNAMNRARGFGKFAGDEDEGRGAYKKLGDG